MILLAIMLLSLVALALSDRYGWCLSDLFGGIVCVIGIALIVVSATLPCNQAYHASKIRIAQDQMYLVQTRIDTTMRDAQLSLDSYQNMASGDRANSKLDIGATNVADAKLINDTYAELYKLQCAIVDKREALRLNRRVGWVFALYVPLPKDALIPAGCEIEVRK